MYLSYDFHTKSLSAYNKTLIVYLLLSVVSALQLLQAPTSHCYYSHFANDKLLQYTFFVAINNLAVLMMLYAYVYIALCS